MRSADVLVYLVSITTHVEKALQLLENVLPLVGDSKKAKHIVLIDDMSVKTHNGSCLPLIVLRREKVQWSVSQFEEFKTSVDGRFQTMHDPQPL